MTEEDLFGKIIAENCTKSRKGIRNIDPGGPESHHKINLRKSTPKYVVIKWVKVEIKTEF